MAATAKAAFAPLSRVLLAVLAGVLFSRSLPPHNLSLLGWAAFAPLFLAAGRTPRGLHAFGLGMLAGITAGVAYVGTDGRGLSATAMNYAFVPFIWIAMVLGVAALAASYARRRWPAGDVRGPLLIACAGVAAEWLTTLSPLPVGVALCQSRTLPVVQLAAVTGIWGVSWLLYLTNAALAETLEGFLAGQPLRRSWRPAALAAGLSLVTYAAGASVLWGHRLEVGHIEGEAATLRDMGADPTDVRLDKGRVLRVAAVQDYNGSEGGADAPAYTGEVPDADALTRQAAARGAKLIVGTENALGTSFEPGEPDADVYRMARETRAHLVVGFESRDQPRPYNCAALVSPGGQTLGVHHKIQLFLGERQTMKPGDGASAWDTSFGKVGLLICFDSCFPAYARQSVRAGARLLAIPNYDPPTPRAVLHHLHAALMPFRAAENRVAIVRAEPSGLSQVVDPWGRVVGRVAPMYRAEAVVADVWLGDGKGTVYTRLGDWFAYACVAAVVAATVMPPLTRRLYKRKAKHGEETGCV